VIYLQVRTHQFINFDDPVYVTKNDHVLAGLTWPGIAWAFKSFAASNWHPLTWISHMIDVQMFGVDAGAHLLVSAAFHALNCVLVFLFLRAATGSLWRSGIVAALFAVHPLRVESVAWVSERKDTLSALFFLLCLLAYTRYVQTRSWKPYVTAVFMLILGLMSKPMLVTTPFVLLILDYWPFKRLTRASLKRVLIEKIPFLLCAAASVPVTILAQRGAISSVNSIPLSVRTAIAATSYVSYLGKTIWPVHLAIMYPLPATVNLTLAIVCAAVLVLITFACFVLRRTMPWLLAGWLWFVGTLVPVIGIVQVGVQSMADRYTYIPHIGLFIALVWTAAWIVQNSPAARVPLAAAASVCIVLLAFTAHAQVSYWADSAALFEHTLAVTSNSNTLAHVNLGAALLDSGDYIAAEREYRSAAGFRDPEVVYNGLALALIGQGRLNEALAAARTAVKANPNFADAWSTLGSIAMTLGDTAEGQAALSHSLQVKADRAVEARLDVSRGDLAAAEGKFDEAVQSKPDDPALRNDYAAVLARLGKNDAAREQYEEALRLRPNFYDARMNYGALLSRLGDNERAAQQFSEAARLQPKSPEPHVYLALIESNGRRFDEAQRDIEQAIAINHDASNRILIDAIRIPPRPAAIDEYLTFLRQQGAGH